MFGEQSDATESESQHYTSKLFLFVRGKNERFLQQVLHCFVCLFVLLLLLVFLFLSTRGRGSRDLRRWRGAPVAHQQSEVKKKQLRPSTGVGQFCHLQNGTGLGEAVVLLLFPGFLLMSGCVFGSRSATFPGRKFVVCFLATLPWSPPCKVWTVVFLSVHCFFLHKEPFLVSPLCTQ